jgi:hypothetical protein
MCSIIYLLFAYTHVLPVPIRAAVIISWLISDNKHSLGRLLLGSSFLANCQTVDLHHNVLPMCRILILLLYDGKKVYAVCGCGTLWKFDHPNFMLNKFACRIAGGTAIQSMFAVPPH